MRIIITGGNGYIGARLCLFLAEKGHKVIPVCYPSVPSNSAWVSNMNTVVEGDIRQEKTIKKICSLNPDIIIHLISLDHFHSEKAPKQVDEVNVLPTWRLLDTCTKKGLKKFIYFSTVQVYGKLPFYEIIEDQAVGTINAYGLTHYLSENICSHFNRNTSTNVITVRLSNSYGDPIFHDNNCWWLAINDLCRSAYLNKEIRLLSDGSPQRDFIHGNDVCQAIDILINSDQKLPDNVYHISSGDTLTLLEIAKCIKKEYKVRFCESLPIITSKGIYEESESDIKYQKFTISNRKLKSLGFLPSYSASRGIVELLNYLERNLNNFS